MSMDNRRDERLLRDRRGRTTGNGARPATAPRPPRRKLGVVLATLFGLFGIAVAAVLWLALVVAPQRLAPALVRAAEQATGRQVVLGSTASLSWSFVPTIVASNVKLENPPGFASADLLTLDRVEARIRLLPLLTHQLDIVRLLLVHPQLHLETNAAGARDWIFAPAAQPGTPTGQQQQPSQTYTPSLEQVQLQDGVITIASPGQQPASVAIASLTGQAASGTAPLNLAAQASYGGAGFTANGTLGPLGALTGAEDAFGGTPPWPVDLTLKSGSAVATVQGKVADPAALRGYDLNVNATIPFLAELAPFAAALPGAPALPALQNVAVQARVKDQNATVPAIDQLVVTAHAADLAPWRPGVSLTAFDVRMPSLDQPVAVHITGNAGTTPYAVSGQLGPVQALLDPKLLPSTMPPQMDWPVSLQATAGAAAIGLQGEIATPEKLSGTALNLTATIPDLTVLAPLAGQPLPAWTSIQAQASVIDPGGLGLRNAVGLSDLSVAMTGAQFGGEASLFYGARPKLLLALRATGLNLDRLIAAWPATPPATLAPAAIPAPVANAGSVPQAIPPVPAVAPAGPAPLVPGYAFPLALIKGWDAQIGLGADQLSWGGVEYDAVQLRATDAGGKLSLDRLTAELPGGSVAAGGAIDATQEPAAERVQATAPALALAPFLKSLGLPDTAQGTVGVRLNATGTGDTLQAMVASLSGGLGVASVNGIIDGGLLDRLLTPALQSVGLPADLVTAPGPVRMRCFAARIDSAQGNATLSTLALDTSRVSLQGGGTLQLGPETLDLTLRPQTSLAGASVSLPVKVSGSFAYPTVATLPGAGNALAAQGVGVATNLLSVLSGSPDQAGSQPDNCPDALAAARFGAEGPMPAAAAPQPVAAPAPAPATPGIVAPGITSTPIPAPASPTAPAGPAGPSGPPKSLLNLLLGK